MQSFLELESDSHIYQLLLAKLQIGDMHNFDARLYMCNEAFNYLDFETIKRLSESSVLIVYCIGIFIVGVTIIKIIISIHKNIYSKQPDDYIQLKNTDSNEISSLIFFLGKILFYYCNFCSYS